MKLIISDWFVQIAPLITILSLVLAIIVLIVDNRNASLSRNVHIANKRQEWVNLFRSYIAEILSIQQRILHQFDQFSLDQLHSILRELSTLTNQVKFMFDPEDINRKSLENSFNAVFANLKDGEKDRVAEEQTRIIKKVDEIIQEQRTKILELDSKNPLI